MEVNLINASNKSLIKQFSHIQQYHSVCLNLCCSNQIYSLFFCRTYMYYFFDQYHCIGDTQRPNISIFQSSRSVKSISIILNTEKLHNQRNNFQNYKTDERRSIRSEMNCFLTSTHYFHVLPLCHIDCYRHYHSSSFYVVVVYCNNSNRFAQNLYNQISVKYRISFYISDQVIQL